MIPPSQFAGVRLVVDMVAIIALAVATTVLVIPAAAPEVSFGTGPKVCLAGVLAGPFLGWRFRREKRRGPSAVSRPGAARAILVASGLLATGLVLTGLAAWGTSRAAKAVAGDRFRFLAERVQDRIRERLDRPFAGLRGLHGLYMASTTVTREDFRTFLALRDLRTEFPGVRVFGWIERVQRANLDAFVAAERADDAPDFAVTANAPDPRLGELPDLYVAKFVEPFEANPMVWGFDVGSEPVRRAALEQAVRSGRPTITQRVCVPLGNTWQPGFLYLHPVFRKGAPVETPEQREAALIGVAYCRVLIEELLSGVSDAADGEVNFELFDGEPSEDARLYDDNEQHGGAGEPPGRSPTFATCDRIALGGREWSIRLASRPKFDAGIDQSTPELIGAGGTLLSLLLAGFVWSLGASRMRAVSLAGRMTAALASSERRMRAIIEAEPECVKVIGADGVLQEINAAGLAMLGAASLEQVRELTLGHFVLPEYREAYAGAFETAMRGGVASLVFEIRSLNGERRWLQTHAVPLKSNTGEVTAVLGVSRDITEQRRAEEKLAASETRFRSLVEGTDVIVWEFDPAKGAFTYVSPQAESLGYPLEDWMVPGFWADHLHPDDRAEAVKFCVEETSRGRNHRFQYRMCRADGGVVWMDDFANVDTSEGGATILRGVLIDVTARKLAQDALAQREEAYRTLFEAVPAAVVVCDSEATVRQYNRRATEIWGREPDVGVDRCCVSFRLFGANGAPVPPERCPLLQVLRTGEPVRGEEFQIERPDGSLVPVSVNFDALRDDTGKIVGTVVVFDDISARKDAETEIVAARLAAESANRAKSEFLANMSHEIRTPLTAILGYADVLREEAGDSSAACIQHIDTIRNAGSHLLSVINDILDLSRIEADKMVIEREDTSLVQVLREVASLARPRAVGKGVELRAVLATPVPERIVCDPTRLRQILMNLVGNAVKFTESGSITISAGVRGVGDGSRLVIDVEDTGPGMSPEQAERLFQPFVQADATVTRRHGGSGLGLNISRRLANLMGGDVTLLGTAPGKGSCFRVILPLDAVAGTLCVDRPDDVYERRGQGTAPAAPIRLSGRVLLAEDGVDNQRLIAFHLKKAGATVVIAENGRVALRCIDDAEAAGSPFDLLLTDIQMPEMDGYTLIRTLRSRASAIPIVALTAHAMAEDRDRCVEVGCDDYATKPIDRDALLAICRLWLSRERTPRAAA